MYLGPGVMYSTNMVVTFVLVVGYMLSVNVELTLYTLIPLPFLSLSIYYVNNIINLANIFKNKKMT
jgi:ATP-binding cassette subfamily B protein